MRADQSVDLFQLTETSAEPIELTDLAEARLVIGRWYEPPGDVDWRIFCQMVMRKRWSRERFQTTLLRFLESKVYRTWKPADFFTLGSPQIYPYSWYLEQVCSASANRSAIGVYRLDGYDKPVYGWKHECEGLLPEWQKIRVAEPKRIAEMTTAMDSETERAILDTQERLRLECERDEALREKRRLSYENSELRLRVEALREQLFELRATLDSSASENAPESAGGSEQ